MLYAFFWVILRPLNFICRRFGTLSVPSSYAYEDGTDRVFRNIGIWNSDAGELPRRKYTTFRLALYARLWSCPASNNASFNHEPWRWLEGIKSRRLARGRLHLLLRNLLIASKQPHNSLSSCCCTLLVPINALKHPDKSFSQSKPLGQLQNGNGPFLGLMLRFPSFFNSALPQNSIKAVSVSSWSLGHRFLIFFKRALPQNINMAVDVSSW